jgi:UDP-N-acetylglucosamine 2-epimerase
MDSETIVSIVGARPQFVKLAPMCRAIRADGAFRHVVVHTGQHYDYRMSKVFFDELEIPEPDLNLEVGSGSHGAQTSEVLRKVEEALGRIRPSWVVVYGDTNSTLGGALAASKMGLRVVHVEAGLRSYRKSMPEETNRVLADHVSSILLCPVAAAAANLRREGFPEAADPAPGGAPGPDAPWVSVVGDIMLDALKMCLPLASRESRALEAHGVAPGGYCLATVHRAENTDDPARLSAILDGLARCGERIVFPVHPRCRKIMDAEGIRPGANVVLADPVGYLDMLQLEKNARAVITDSGGVQKESFLLGVPCVTVRGETEWRETLEEGRNRLAGANAEATVRAIGEAVRMGPFRPSDAFGDGTSAQRSVAILRRAANRG